MPANRFPNATKEELILLLESLQRRATMGQIYMTTYAGDQQMRSFQGAPTVKIAMDWVLYALHEIDPEAYANPHTAKVRRVRPNYSY